MQGGSARMRGFWTQPLRGRFLAAFTQGSAGAAQPWALVRNAVNVPDGLNLGFGAYDRWRTRQGVSVSVSRI